MSDIHQPPPDLPGKLNLPSRIDLNLCCDLDGTLVQTDLLMESVLLLFKHHPLCLIYFPVWLIKGKAYFKEEVQKRVQVEVDFLPYNTNILHFLRSQKLIGRRIILATASHQNVANAVAQHLGLFDEVFGSSSSENLRGKNKARLLTHKFGLKNFDYIGNDFEDLAIWKCAAGALVANPTPKLLKETKEIALILQTFSPSSSRWVELIKLIRPHQISKNSLIFLPLIASQRVFDSQALGKTLIAAAAFSLCAWSGYIFNDFLDINSDRRHPKKKNRPFASGRLTILFGIVILISCALMAFFLSSLLPASFTFVLVSYYSMTLLYSFFIKNIIMMDVIWLAALYVIRIFAGHESATIAYSPWLLAFSMFFFLSLALLKRYSELKGLSSRSLTSAHGRAYLVMDMYQIGTMGTASGYISVLVFVLYLNSQEVLRLYHKPEVLWLLCPILLFWIGRGWLIANRNQMHYDPIVFAIRDPISILTGFFFAIVFLSAIYL